jgi:hypothetical protein
MRSKIFIAVLCLCLPFLACVQKIAGGSTETTNPAVAGVLYQPDGKTPAAGVRVHIRPQKTLADTSGTGLSKRAAILAATDSVVTDSAGRYAFDTTLDTGTYVIEAASGNNAVLVDSVAVKSKATTDSLAADTLKPAGALKGVIKLSEGGDPRKVFVLAFGIDRFARVNADGSFKFSNLAEAKYDLRLISSLDNYGVLDTVGVSVKSADTTDLDTVTLPFTGVPTPKNVRIAYDTLKQIVTLTWSKADTALVKSYNVYRRNVDSNTVAVRINASPVVDTVYKDSTGVQGTTYEYMVAAMNKSATEGTKSAVNTVVIITAYRLSDTLGTLGSADNQLNMPRTIVCVGSNYVIADIVAPYPSATKLKIFSPSQGFVKAFTVRNSTNAELLYSWAIAADGRGIIYMVFKDTTYRLDTTGQILGKYALPIVDASPGLVSIFLRDTVKIYSLNRGTQIVTVRDTTGATIETFPVTTTSYGSYALAVDSSGTVLVADRDQRSVSLYSAVGALSDTWNLSSTGAAQIASMKNVVFDARGHVFVDDAAAGDVKIFNRNGQFIGGFESFLNTKIWQGTVNDNTDHVSMVLNPDGTLGILEGNVYNALFLYSNLASIFLP